MRNQSVERPLRIKKNINTDTCLGSEWDSNPYCSTDRGRRNSLKACALLVVIAVILSLMKNFLDLNSLMLNKY
jgi:hypothetical protein